MILVFCFKKQPVALVQFSAILDGLLLTPLQAIWVAIGLFWVMPRLLSKDAAEVLRPNWVFAVALLITALVFGYFCIFQVPSAVMSLICPK
jgi:phosphate/sulfate permease